MSKKNYKILVLSDLGKKAETILKNTAGMAKMVGGEVSLLHVKKPLVVVKQENQLSAIRSINDTYTSTEKTIKKLLEPITSDYGIMFDTTFKVGNVKEEINKKIREFNPDIIVLGQRKSRPIRLLGDGITKHIMSNFNGLIMIASHEQVIDINKELSLGVLNGPKESLKAGLFGELMEKSSKPLKSFKIASRKDNSATKEQMDLPMVEYVFEPQDNVINNVSTYLTKTNVDFLYMDMEEPLKANINVKNVIGKFKVPFVITGKHDVKLANAVN